MRISLVAFAIAAVLTLPNTAAALTWKTLPPSLADMAELSSLAFRGRVLSVTGPTTKLRTGQLPYQRVTFVSELCFRGCKAGQKITIFQAGGPIPGTTRGVVIPGLPLYAPSDRVYVLANDTVHPGTGALWGEHGIHRIVWSPDGDEIVLDPDWRALSRSGGKTQVVAAGRRCLGARKDRGVCPYWEKERSKSATSPGANAIGRKEFDQVLASIFSVAPKRKGPAQTVSATEKQFRSFVMSPAPKSGGTSK